MMRKSCLFNQVMIWLAMFLVEPGCYIQYYTINPVTPGPTPDRICSTIIAWGAVCIIKTDVSISDTKVRQPSSTDSRSDVSIRQQAERPF